MNTAAPDVAHDISLGVVIVAEPNAPTALLETALERPDPDGSPRITDSWYQNGLDLSSTDAQIRRGDPHISATRPYASTTSHTQAEKRPKPFLSPNEAEPGRHTSWT